MANFSYTIDGLQNQGLNSLKGYQVRTTSYESKDGVLQTYKAARGNIKKLQQYPNVSIFHGVDATLIKNHPYLGMNWRYDIIAFNFPHLDVDPEHADQHHDFLDRILKECIPLLKPGEVLWLLLNQNYPYTSWDIRRAVDKNNRKADYVNFVKGHYPLYEPKKGRGSDPDAVHDSSNSCFFNIN